MEEKLNSTSRSETMYSCGNDVLDTLLGFAVAPRVSLKAILSHEEEFIDLMSYLKMKDAEDFKAIYTDEQLFKFRSVNGTPLKGLLRFGEDVVTVDFKDLPEDHMVLEVLAAQRDFVVHRLVEKCRKRLFMMANREFVKLTPEYLEEMPLGMLEHLAELVEVLTDTMTAQELKQNEWGKLKERCEKAMSEKLAK